MGGIGRAVYGALAEQKQAVDGVARSDFWANQLRDRVAEFGGDAAHLDIEQLRKTLPRLPQDLITVMAATQDWLKVPGKSVLALWEPYSQAESARKGLRARLPDREAARKRRAEWIAEEHPTAVPLHYRWSHVQRLLGDLLI
jgi:hypothetical protein